MHPVEEYQDIITLTVDRLNEGEIVTPTRRRWTLNYYITQCTGNSINWGSDELERRCWNENMSQRDWAPRPPLSSPGERERNAEAQSFYSDFFICPNPPNTCGTRHKDLREQAKTKRLPPRQVSSQLYQLTFSKSPKILRALPVRDIIRTR